MRKFYSLVTVLALAYTAQAQQESTSFIWANQNFQNAQDVTTGDILQGKITYNALKNGASNAPKYYTTGNSLRLYSSNADGNGNSLELATVGEVRMQQVKIITDTFADYAPLSAIITVDGAVVPTVKDPANANIYLVDVPNSASNVTIKNGQTGTSAQIRIQQIDILYTNTLGVADYTQASKAIQNTIWKDVASFSTKGLAKIEIFNTNGQLVKSLEVNGNKNVDVSDLAAGVYVVKSTENGKSISTKVVKK